MNLNNKASDQKKNYINNPLPTVTSTLTFKPEGRITAFTTCYKNSCSMTATHYEN